MRALGVLFKILGYLVLLVAIAFAGGYLWLTRYVQTPEFSQKVQNSIQSNLGTEIQFQEISFNFIRGLEVQHIKIPNPKSRVAPVLIEARRLQLGYSILALLNNEIQIANFRIVDPMIFLEDNSSTGIVLPAATRSAKLEKAENNLPALPEGWKISVKSIEFQNASLRIVDSLGKPIVHLTSIELLASLNSLFPALTGTGTLHIGEIKVGNYLIRDFSSSVSVGNNDLNLINFDAKFYQGQLNGNFEISLTGPAYPYTLKLDANAVDVNQMLAASTKTSVLSGKLSCKTFWRGPLNTPSSLVGKGSAEIINGQLIDVPLWKLMGQLPGLGQLSQPDFSQITTSFDVANQSILLSALTVKSALVELFGTGTVSFDKALDLQTRLSLNPDLARQLPLAAEEHLTRRVDGYREVSFAVKGTMENPSIDLAQKLMLQNLNLPATPEAAINAVKDTAKDPAGALKNILGVKPTPAESPTSAPSPTPVPTP